MCCVKEEVSFKLLYHAASKLSGQDPLYGLYGCRLCSFCGYVHLPTLLALSVSCSVFHSGRALGIGGCTVVLSGQHSSVHSTELPDISVPTIHLCYIVYIRTYIHTLVRMYCTYVRIPHCYIVYIRTYIGTYVRMYVRT